MSSKYTYLGAKLFTGKNLSAVKSKGFASQRRLLKKEKFMFGTFEEAQTIAETLASLCPDPSTALLGIMELLLNAIEHGNLDIGYDCKSMHLEKGNYRNEVERRLRLSANKHKKASVVLEKSNAEIAITVRDEGKGFHWPHYIDFDPKRMGDRHGRGIALAASVSFSNLQYNDMGNEVIGLIKLTDPMSVTSEIC